MKIFVTGGTGYLGKNFIELALKRNHYIFATTREHKKNKKNLKWLKGPFYKNWKELKKADVLIHFAAEGVYNKSCSLKKCIDVNLIKSQRLIFNALNAKCRKWIIISSCYEKILNYKDIVKRKFKDKKNHQYFNYALSKYLFTKLCISIAKKNKIKCRVLRLFQIYGKNENKKRLWPSLINASKKNKNFKMSLGHQINDFSHVDDLSKTLMQTLNFNIKNKSFPQLWDVASGKNQSVKSFASRIWKKRKSKGKLLFGKIKSNNINNFKSNKKILWKIKFNEQKMFTY